VAWFIFATRGDCGILSIQFTLDFPVPRPFVIGHYAGPVPLRNLGENQRAHRFRRDINDFTYFRLFNRGISPPLYLFLGAVRCFDAPYRQPQARFAACEPRSNKPSRKGRSADEDIAAVYYRGSRVTRRSGPKQTDTPSVPSALPLLSAIRRR